MAFIFKDRYEPHIEAKKKGFRQSLSEKDRRRFATLEAARLGHGGTEYIASVLGCSTKTIARGEDELDQLPCDANAGRVRGVGAGRKKKLSPSSS